MSDSEVATKEDIDDIYDTIVVWNGVVMALVAMTAAPVYGGVNGVALLLAGWLLGWKVLALHDDGWARYLWNATWGRLDRFYVETEADRLGGEPA